MNPHFHNWLEKNTLFNDGSAELIDKCERLLSKYYCCIHFAHGSLLMTFIETGAVWTIHPFEYFALCPGIECICRGSDKETFSEYLAQEFEICPSKFIDTSDLFQQPSSIQDSGISSQQLFYNHNLFYTRERPVHLGGYQGGSDGEVPRHVHEFDHAPSAA